MSTDRVVWKYHLHSPTTELRMPGEAFPLTAQVQGDDIVVWVERQESAANDHAWTFRLVMTGEPIPNGASYLATMQLGVIVLHVYYLPPKKVTHDR